MKMYSSLLKYILFPILILLSAGCGEQARKPGGKEPGPAGTPAHIGIAPADPSEPFMIEGKKVYDQYCLVCHQVNGSGVTGLNPPLQDTEYVLGDKARLITIILNGSNEGLWVNGAQFTNAMPGFPNLGDEEIAHVASYIRNSFGNAAEPVAVEEVTELRTGWENKANLEK